MNGLSTRLKVLHIVPYYQPAVCYGGPVRSVSALCAHLVKRGADVTVFTSDANGDEALDVPLGSPVDMDGVQVYYFRREAPRGFFHCPALLRTALHRAGEFDLVHSCALWTYFMHASARACARASVPRIDSPRGGLMPFDLHQKYWKKWTYLALIGRYQLNAAARLHCTDEIEAEAVRALGLKPPISVVPNPVDSCSFERLPSRGVIRAKLGIPKESPVTVFMGRLASKKGLDLAIRAFPEVLRRQSSASFLIAGAGTDGTYREAVRLVRVLGLQGRVHFLGEVNGATRLAAFADADLFILTSHSENFGMAPAEAMAAGLPVLLSDRVGICRSAVAAGAGEATSLDVNQIAVTWSDMLRNPENLRRMGERGQALVRREYDPDVVAAKMLQLYEQVIYEWSSRGAKPTANTGAVERA